MKQKVPHAKTLLRSNLKKLLKTNFEQFHKIARIAGCCASSTECSNHSRETFFFKLVSIAVFVEKTQEKRKKSLENVQKISKIFQLFLQKVFEF